MTGTKELQGKDWSNKTIGEFVADDYRIASVFEKYGIDFCCGGHQTLAAACQERELELQTVRQEIEAAGREPMERRENFAAWELSFLADYIVNNHHTYLNENTGPIAAYAHKIAEVHGAHHPEVKEIAIRFDQVAADLVEHLREEEEVLFPAIKRIEAARKAGNPAAAKDLAAIKSSLQQLHREHEAVGDGVHEIRRLANGYALPADVCNTFMLTYRKLKEFEDDIHKHVHLENNILFRKAAEL
ncbi:MAG: iron-sulfur cluster repair di-iron protein [Desulfuromonadales bacterium]|nr:iron-sulfur cluster repair di-iron protein [Desulfuromonadales bacterium]